MRSRPEARDDDLTAREAAEVEPLRVRRAAAEADERRSEALLQRELAQVGASSLMNWIISGRGW